MEDILDLYINYIKGREIMKSTKKGFCLIITLFMAFNMTACSSQTSQMAETPYYAVTIDGEKKYYGEEEESVKQLKELTEAYLMLSQQKNYQKPEGVQEELNFFSESYRAQQEAANFVESTVSQLNYYQLENEVSEHNVTEILYKSQHGDTMATVTCEYITSIKHATDEYLASVQVKANTNYKRVLTLDAVLENGEWKVQKYSNSAREEI